MRRTNVDGREYLSTGEAARLYDISVSHVVRLFDRGMLEGFRVPGSRFRRISRASLEYLMAYMGVPRTQAL